VADQFQTAHGIDLRASIVAKARLLNAVEAAKRQLSEHPFARVEEEFVAEKDGQALHLTQEISRLQYEALIRPLLNRTMDCVQRALDDARLTASQIDKVVLVGGSTRTPIIVQLLEERLDQQAHQEVNPDLCVAMGAAIQAALIAGLDVGAVLVDITPHSLGIKCLDVLHGLDFPFRFAPILHRNTPLPASRSEVFNNVHDNQHEVDIDVYQGESDDVRHNHRVGRFMIQGLAKVPAGNQLVVQLDLNLDGMLKVSAREKATGLQKQVTIENPFATYQREERAVAQQRLDRLWGDAQDESEGVDEDEEMGAFEDSAPPELVAGPREGQRETVQARALLEKAERLSAAAPPEDKAEVQRLMTAVRNALTDRHWEQLTTACNELSDVLFYLEDA
jgi:molecular chaperone DnaK